MIRTYRIWRNMDAEDVKAGKDISVQLFQCPNLFVWAIYELHAAAEECCSLLHHVPIPKWLANWEGNWGCECKPPAPDTKVWPDGWKDEGCDCWSKFGHYYGDSWGDMWHWAVETPLGNYLYRRYPAIGSQWVNASLKDLDAPPVLQDIEWIHKEIEREKKYAAEHGGDGCHRWPGGVMSYGDLPHIDYPGSSWLYKFMEWATRRVRTPMCDGTGTQSH
jgi:hypothetical protein